MPLFVLPTVVRTTAVRTFGARAVLRGLLLSSLIFTSVHICASDAVDAARQTITLSLKQEPPNLNSVLTVDQISAFVLGHVMEGLLSYDGKGELAPGVATRWQLRKDGATFWLRRDARWSDGRPVTARDFVFAWRQVVSPATASPYASAMFPIKNGERINNGELPSTTLGVRAIDDHRLDVQFERPCPYFLGLTALFTYYPVRADFYQQRGERYAADAEDLLYNGPFLLTQWVHGARLTLTKNPNYWNRDAVRLNRIDIPYVTGDVGANFNLFKSGNIALAELDGDSLNDALVQGFPVRQFNSGGVFFLQFNLRDGHVTANRHLRKAIQAVFDQGALVYKVLGQPGTLPTSSLFPSTMKGIDGPFREEYPPPPVQRSLGIAREHLARAKQELGVEQIPPLVLLASDSPTGGKEAEYFQQLLSAGLGLDVRIDRQIFKQRIDRMQRGQFDIAASSWGPDYDDLMTFADLFASWNNNNRAPYLNPDYDEKVRLAGTSSDPAVRMQAFADMQRMLIDDVPILPTYENGLVYVQHPRLLGVVRAVFGPDPNFTRAYVADEGQGADGGEAVDDDWAQTGGGR